MVATMSPKRRSLLILPASLLCAPLRIQAAPPDRAAIIRQVFKTPVAAVPYGPEHAVLMRRLRVLWVPVESGAPGIEFEDPLGPDSLSIARAALKTSDDSRAIRKLAEVGLLVPRYVAALGRLAPGRYALPAEMRPAFDFPESGVDADGGFMLREEHLTLLRAADWRTVDRQSIESVLREGPRYWPMPYIDGKRPYGNSSYYQVDMARLLGEPYPVDARGYARTDPAKDARLERLHRETLAALQVFLAHSSAQPPSRPLRRKAR